MGNTTIPTDLSDTTLTVDYKHPYDRKIRDFFEVCVTLQKNKRNDYTGDKDPDYNYRKSGEIANITAAQSMLVRMQEKLIRLSIFLGGKVDMKVTDESLQDTCKDIAILAAKIANWGVDYE